MTEVDDIYSTPSGKWSIRCPQCGKRTARKYSADYVYCRACMEGCAAHGHVPDDDDANTCYVCGWHIRAGKARRRSDA